MLFLLGREMEDLRRSLLADCRMASSVYTETGGHLADTY